MVETWKFIDGFNWVYQVSNLGRVRTLDRIVNSRDGKCRFYCGELLNTHLNKHGYAVVYLRRDGKTCTITVHKLVAQAFIPPVNGKPDVNHKDGDKSNNQADNLEWCTKLENIVHAYTHGLVSHKKPLTKETRRIYCLENNIIYSGTADVAKLLGVTTVRIREAIRKHQVLRVKGIGYTFIRIAEVEEYLKLKAKIDSLLDWQFSAIDSDLGFYFNIKR